MDIDWNSWTREAAEHLSRLIRLNTVNPPGNERVAADYLARLLEEEGLKPEVLGRSSERGNLIVRYPGSGSKRPFLLFSHLDTVPALEDGWIRAPFSGDLHEGYVWGRGAIDCKYVGAVWLTLMRMLARYKPKLARDIIFAATADEEQQAEFGMAWLAREHFDKIDAEAALTENGGMVTGFLGQKYMVLATAEKGFAWVRIRARGRAGHASVPHDRNPNVAIAKAVSRIASMHRPARSTSTTRRFVEALGKPLHPSLRPLIKLLAEPHVGDRLIRLVVRDKETRENLHAVFHDTYCCTVLSGGQSSNVIPDMAEAVLDVRMLPGRAPAEVMAGLRRELGADFELELEDSSEANESPADSSLVAIIAENLRREAPDIRLLPVLFPGVSDARFLRRRGMAVYGFVPLSPKDDARRAHGVNERVSLEGLNLALQSVWGIIRDFAE